MGSLQTKIQIWNMTLDILKEQPLASVSDAKATALWLARNYDQQRDFLMESMLWKFALTRASIAADGTAPSWGWTYQYTAPTDCMRIIPPTYSGIWMGTPIPYESENSKIMMNVAGPLYLRYITRITNEGLFTNGFVEVLSLRLARKLAHWMTGKASMIESIDTQLKETLDIVRTTEAVQLAGGRYYDDDIAQEREAFY